MIGRVPALSNLLGPVRTRKTPHLRPLGDFERFEIEQPEADPAPSKSIMQLVFEARINLVETALAKADLDTVSATVELIRKDINTLPNDTIAVREKWKEKTAILAKGVLDQLAPPTVAALKSDIAPLMQWIYTRDHSDAYGFDLLTTNAQIELLRDSGRLADYRDQIRTGWRLLMHLNPVRKGRTD